MATKGLDLSKFKKMSSDDKKTTLRSAKGHTIELMHSALTPEFRKQLNDIPEIPKPKKMADGGEASVATPQPAPNASQPSQDSGSMDANAKTPAPDQGDSSKAQAPVVVNVNNGQQPTQEPAQDPSQDPGLAYKLGHFIGQNHPVAQIDRLAAKYGPPAMHAIGNGVANVVAGATGNKPVQDINSDGPNTQAQMAMPTAAPAPSPAQQVQAAPAPPSPADKIGPGGVGLTAQMLRQGLTEQEQGLKGEAAASAAQGQQEAVSAGQAQDNLQQVYKNFGDEMTAANQERSHLIQAIQNQHIDPKHYVQNMSTGSKIASGIGLLLGGMASGTLGGENPALAILQKNIDRDIDAQKANLGKNNTLLEANMGRFKNNEAAAAMTKSMMNDMLAMRLKQVAGTNIGPMAQARAQQAAGALHANAAQQLGQAAWQEAMYKQMQSGGAGAQGSATDPALLVPLYVPKDDQKAAYGEIKAAQNITTKTKDIMAAFDALQEKLSTPQGKAMALIHPPREAAAVEQLLTATAEPLEGSVKTATVDSIHKNLMSKITDVGLDPALRRKAITDYLVSASSAPVVKGSSHGMIDLAKFNSTNVKGATEKQLPPAQQKYLDWAKQNPNNPKAQAVLKKLGGS